MSYNYENDDFEIDEFSDSDDLKTQEDGDYKWTDDLFEKAEIEEYDADIIEKQTNDNNEDYDHIYDEHTIDTGSIEFFQKERINEVTGKKVKNYVNNDTFCSEVIRWNALRKEAELNNKAVPPMPDCIGKQIMLMADGLSKRYNFRNYTYKVLVEVLAGAKSIEDALAELDATWATSTQDFNPVTGAGF